MAICQRGYVTESEIGYELDDRRERLKAAEGEAFSYQALPVMKQCAGRTT